MKPCQSCNEPFNPVSSNRRKFCYVCSPLGTKDKRDPKERKLDEDGQRNCYKCKSRKPLDLFTKSKSEKTGHSWLCKQCASDRVILTQQQTKVKCLLYKGGKCQICGYDKCNRSLHFHHINPSEKDFSLAKYRCRSWETMKAELDKCLLLCANCHGEIHDGIISLPSN